MDILFVFHCPLTLYLYTVQYILWLLILDLLQIPRKYILFLESSWYWFGVGTVYFSRNNEDEKGCPWSGVQDGDQSVLWSWRLTTAFHQFNNRNTLTEKNS